LTKDTQPPRRFPLIDRVQVFAGRRFDFFVDQVEISKDATVRREVVHHPGAVAIVPALKTGDVLLVRQARPAVDRELWEIPAGTLEADEPAADCARRELREETGYVASDWTALGVFFTSPGICDEQMSLFLARDLTRVGEFDPREISLCRPFRPEELRTMVACGEIQDAKTLIGLYATGLLGSVAETKG